MYTVFHKKNVLSNDGSIILTTQIVANCGHSHEELLEADSCLSQFTDSLKIKNGEYVCIMTATMEYLSENDRDILKQRYKDHVHG